MDFVFSCTEQINLKIEQDALGKLRQRVTVTSTLVKSSLVNITSINAYLIRAYRYLKGKNSKVLAQMTFIRDVSLPDASRQNFDPNEVR